MTQFFGKYRGVVTNVHDPMHVGRLQAEVPSVLGHRFVWCLPCAPYAGENVGFVCLPEIGANVWIEFEGGDVDHPIWSGCFWLSPQTWQGSPAAKVWRTRAGHQIRLDDGTLSIEISDAHGNLITMNSQGITLERDGRSVKVSDSSVTIDDTAVLPQNPVRRET